MIKKNFLTIALLLFSFTLQANERSILKLQESVLESFDQSNKTLVFGGKQYLYEFDHKNSRYRFVDDLKKSINLSSLKSGETYFFQIKVQVGDTKKKKYDTVIFIAKSKPSE